ncbi:MAG: putative sugar O-methyltransferase [Planctomycetes bacterium]|nr:putative sugar O-methyltransferase [Planctomycetota bacterium]
MQNAPTVAEENQRILKSFATKIADLERGYSGVNPFWSGLLEDVAVDDLDRMEVDQIAARLSSTPRWNYLMTPEDKHATIIDDRIIDSVTEFVVKARAPKELAEAGDKEGFELAVGLVVLTKLGVLYDALRWHDKLKIHPKLVTLRHSFYFSRVEALIENVLQREKVRVLEIGAGGGTLRTFMKRLLPERVGAYAIVDLPQLIFQSAYSASKFLPREPIRILGVDDAAATGSGDDVFATPQFAETVAEKVGPFDLILNTHSFQEMDEGVIAEYFDLIHRHAAPGAVFFNANWQQAQMSRLDGTVFDNDPYRYPYRESDEVLYWGPDPFHEHAGKLGYKGKIRTCLSVRRIG